MAENLSTNLQSLGINSPLTHNTMEIKKKPKKTKQNMKDLPREIVLDIISRLPVNTILRLINNQSHGLTIIASNPLFAQIYRSHHNTTRTRSNNCSSSFLAYDPRHGSNNDAFLVEYLSKHNKTLTTRLSMEFLQPQERSFSSFIVVNSCNGWILVRLPLCRSDSQHQQPLDSLRVVNPVTQCCFILPPLLLDKSITSTPVVPIEYGLGFSAKTGQYKVVRFITYPGDDYYSVEVLTVEGRSSAWRRLDQCKITLWKYGLVSGPPVAWNGGLHWLLRAHNLILRFDLDKERLEFISTPYSPGLGLAAGCNNIISVNHRRVFRGSSWLNASAYNIIWFNEHMSVNRVGVLEGKSSSWLYVSAYNMVEFDECMAIWVMTDYDHAKVSWTPLTFMHGVYPYMIFDVIRVLEDDGGGNKKIMVLFHDGTKLLDRYHPNIMKWDKKPPMIRGIAPKVKKNMNVVVYEPSFLTLKDLGC